MTLYKNSIKNIILMNIFQCLCFRNTPVKVYRKINCAAWFLVLLLCIQLPAPCQAQIEGETEENVQKKALTVFAEGGISRDYMKREIRFINYVRDPRMADVYVLITSQSTGSGGTEYTITYQGQNNYKGIDDTLKFIRNRTDTYEIYRRGMIKVIKQGLMRYVATTPTINDISVSFKPSVRKIIPEIDKWKKWVFSIGFDAELDVEKYEKEYDFNINLSASKITEKWKITSYFSYDYNENRFEYEERTIKDIRRRLSAKSMLAKKIGDHWGIGVMGNINSDVRYNNKLSVELSPTIEFNLYPYSEFSRRQFPIRIGISLSHNDYYEETIYNKTSEFLSKMFMSAANIIQGKWGSVINVVRGSFYIQDFNKN
ncbi:MAG: hypothetical protein KAU46_09805, partial [Candidatus Aminicenantes bacterium]|nr:hypothetical protein [Candidatus Aminicenantes bacterium]